MLKKNFLFITLIVTLLAAGVAADVFFWKRIAANNQHQQDHWQNEVDILSAQLAQQQTALAALQDKLSQFMRSQQQNSVQQTLNEIAYLLDLANLYLQINRDKNSAVKSLQLAQQQLQTLADPSLLPLREALARDLNSVNDAPSVDTAEVLIKLQTLAESIDRLTLTPGQASLSPLPTAAATPTENTSPWYRQLWRTLWSNFKGLFVINYYNTHPSPVVPPQQREWLRENIAFTLAQAQWAVLQQKSGLYEHSLMQVREWLTNNYPDDARRKQILNRLAELTVINVTPNLPDLHVSLNTVQQTLKNLPTLSTPAMTVPALPPAATAQVNTPPPATPEQPEKNTTPTAIGVAI